MGRGVRQGDLLSAYLFILVIELLANAIRSDEAIKGISIGNRVIKSVIYADDLSATVSNIGSAKRLFELFEYFGQFSGLKLNLEKTEALWLGSAKNCKRHPLGIKWPSKPIKALGVYFSYDEKRCEEDNFEAKLKSLKAKLDIWKSRDLSIYGRILQIKSLGISQILYLSSVISVPEHVVSRIEQLTFNFLWKGGGDKVKRRAVINFSRDGGLEIIDIRSMIKSLQCKWTLRYLNKKEGTWNSIINHYFKPLGSDLLC